jgi:amidase
MNTTAGSYALLGGVTVGDAFVVKALRNAGVIILAHANMNEFAGEFGRANSSGYSARGGQTSSAYVEGGFSAGGDPGGSSGGSAVSVSAGFVTFSLGSDTEGSILDPSSKAGLYGMRPSTGLYVLLLIPFVCGWPPGHRVAPSPLLLLFLCLRTDFILLLSLLQY